MRKIFQEGKIAETARTKMQRQKEMTIDIPRIIESAKEQLPEVKSRWELIERLAKQYNLSPNTINVIFCKQHFRTGLGNYFIGKKEASEKQMMKFFEFIKEQPRFVSEVVKENFFSHTNYYRRLRVLNYPIQRMNITGKGSTKRKYDRTIYFTTDQNQRVEAYKRLIERFPLKTTGLILPVLDGYKEKIEEFKLAKESEKAEKIAEEEAKKREEKLKGKKTALEQELSQVEKKIRKLVKQKKDIRKNMEMLEK
jgi:hypothetical protein